jgi:hypothetical protein
MGLVQREGDPEDVLSLEEVAELLGRPDWPRRNLMRVIREHGIDTFRPGRSEMLKRKALPMLEDAMTKKRQNKKAGRSGKSGFPDVSDPAAPLHARGSVLMEMQRKLEAERRLRLANRKAPFGRKPV